jgi:hypothetical protein
MHMPLEPVVALVAGILIFLMPRLLNYIVASYLVVIGLMGLLGAHPWAPVPTTEARLMNPADWLVEGPSATPHEAPPAMPSPPPGRVGRVELLVFHPAQGEQAALHRL